MNNEVITESVLKLISSIFIRREESSRENIIPGIKKTKPTKFIQKGSAILKYFVELSYLIYLLNVLALMIISDGFYKAEFSHVNICLLTFIIGFIFCVRL